MNEANPQADSLPTPSLVVFGIDDKGKPHASAFKAEDAELAEKAAGLMSMHVLRLIEPEHLALAVKLPVGRIFASGKGFVPFVGRPLYEALCAAAGITPAEQPARVPAAKGSSARKGTPEPDTFDLPTTPDAIAQNSLVLACEGPAIGWFESVVVEVKPDDLFVMQWRDWPDMPRFARRRDQLALLPACELASV